MTENKGSFVVMVGTGINQICGRIEEAGLLSLEKEGPEGSGRKNFKIEIR
jgi:hypothetical protein